MNKKTLSTAVLAGLTGIAGIVSVSNAVHVNPDGTGQVLIYPYYTTRSDNVTLISVVNTTEDAKAVKVRFIEGVESFETRDFNLYMSPFDVWTASISDDPGRDGARFVTRDNTCTVPRFFNPATGSSAESAASSFDDALFPGQLDRTREGYVEMIEMGTLLEPYFSFSIHGGPADVNGNPLPASCAAFVDAWTTSPTVNGVWVDPAFPNPEQRFMDAPSGGLFGDAVIVDVPGARAQGYSATALDAFYVPNEETEISLHQDPGSPAPSLGDAFPFTSGTLLATGNAPVYVQDSWPIAPQAVTAALLVDNIHNQFDVDPGINGATEWVITFPTKRLHSAGPVNVAPFSNIFNGTALQDCENFTMTIFDRNEQVTPTPPEPSPELVQGLALCTEANVISFQDATTAGPGTETNIFGSSRDNGVGAVNFDVQAQGFTSGWGQLSFNDDNDIDINVGTPFRVIHTMESNEGNTHFGLPAVGFAARAADNAGVGALFGAIVDHAVARRIE